MPARRRRPDSAWLQTPDPSRTLSFRQPRGPAQALDASFITLLATGALGILCVALLWLLVGRLVGPARSPLQPDSYAAREALLTAAERRFFEALSASLARESARESEGDDLVVCCQVRLADIVRVAGESGTGRWWRAFRAVAQKHVDFVICDRESFAILCVIELQDRSHVTDPRRRARDDLVRAVLDQADIPLLEIPVQARYDQIDLMLALRRTLSRDGNARSGDSEV